VRIVEFEVTETHQILVGAQPIGLDPKGLFLGTADGRIGRIPPEAHPYTVQNLGSQRHSCQQISFTGIILPQQGPIVGLREAKIHPADAVRMVKARIRLAPGVQSPTVSGPPPFGRKILGMSIA